MYAEASQTLKHFIFLEFFWFVCFPPIYAILAKKDLTFLKKGVKGWETDKLQIFFGKQTK